MKVIDFSLLGNVLRLYYGADDLEEWYGDDWNDRPYEHNAGNVYDRFISRVIDYAFDTGFVLAEPCTGEWNSPWCKEDMINQKVPCCVIAPIQDKYYDNTFLSVSAKKEAARIYFGMSDEEVEKEIKKIRGSGFCEAVAWWYMVDGNLVRRKGVWPD